jgi:preprotein translocase subunit SecF
MNFLKYSKIYFVISALLIFSSIACLVVFKLNFGIEFTGGSLLEVEYLTDRPSNQEIQQTLTDLNLGNINVQPIGEKEVSLEMKSISEEIHQQILQKLGDVQENSFQSIGPTIGKELRGKTGTLVVISLLAMLFYIAFAFRKVQRPVSSWQYGIASLLALFHDILIPLGVFAVLGKYYGVEITIPVIAALLTVLGYSINNVVVVFDRIRENTFRRGSASFEETVNNSLKQTLTRCVNTSFTTLLTLFAIFFFGGESLKYFTLALIIGVLAGLYSSLFLASPILVWWLKIKHKG